MGEKKPDFIEMKENKTKLEKDRMKMQLTHQTNTQYTTKMESN